MDKTSLDRFHYHEALDRLSLFRGMFEDYIQNHPVVSLHYNVSQLSVEVQHALRKLESALCEVEGRFYEQTEE